MSPPIRDGSGDSIGSIRLGDGSEISEVRTGAGDVLFSGFPSDLGSTLLAYGSDDNVYVHDVSSGFPLNSTLSQAGSRVRGGVSFSPDNSLLAYGEGFGGNDNVYVHDVGGGFPLNSTLTDPGGTVKTVDFSAGNNFLMVSEGFTGSDEIFIYDVPSLSLNTSFSAATDSIFSFGSFNSV